MCSPSPGPGARAGSPGVRLSLIGAPSRRTGSRGAGLLELDHHLPGARPARTPAPRRGRAPAPGSSRARRRTLATAPGCARRRSPATARCVSDPGGSNAPAEQVLAPHAPAERVPELRLERAERHVAVGALVGPVAGQRAGQRQLAPPRPAADRERLGGHQRQPRQRAVEHRAVDELPLAGALALAQRDEDPDQRPSARRRRGRRSGRRTAPGGPSAEPVRPSRPLRPR